ncbi:MAG: hypothetical protein KGL39_25330 [Patescibacteria group bacterium]|nr:hypothetical protein [Patescibacteria group bacterium]
MFSDFRLALAGIAGAVALIALGACDLLLRDDMAQRAKVAGLQGELKATETAKKASEAALTLAINTKGEIQHDYQTIIREIPATSDACRRDPGVLAAYAAIQRLRDKDGRTLGTAASGPTR